MTPKSMIGHSPSGLAYGSEAMILVELKVPPHQVNHCNPRMNEELLLESLDMIDEKHDEADLRASTY